MGLPRVLPLCSQQLAFTRDGHSLVTVDRGAVTVVDTRTHGTRRIPVDHAIAAVGFADQLWIAHGHEPKLTRHALDGRELGAAVALESNDGLLIAAPVGVPAAIWTSTPMLVAIEDAGELTVGQLPSMAELAIPLTGRRFVTASGSRVLAPSGLSCELSAGSRIVGGAVVLDGTAVVVVAERPSGRELVVIGLANGRLQLRQHVIACELRAAARRGLLAMRVAHDRIAVVDLRSGRVAGELACPRDLVDFALDPDGQRIALRGSETAVELLSLRDAFAARPEAVTVVEAEQAQPVSSSEPVAAAPPVAPSEPPIALASRIRRPLDVRVLAPRSQIPLLARDPALAVLDLETRSVALWTLLAIAEAWDTRRLGYGNEGRHPFEHEVAALLGMNHGFAAEHVAAARAHLAAHEVALAALPDRRAATTPLGALAGELGLSPLAIDILLVVAAPVLRTEVARLYGVLANDPSRALVDEALVEQVLGPRVPRHQLAAELDPRGPLVRLGVIASSPSTVRPFAGLTVDPIVLARLRHEVPELGGQLSTRGSDRALEELAVGPGTIEDALLALARATTPARIALRGRPGSGRRTLLAALAAEAGRALGLLDIALLPRTDGQLASAIRTDLRRAQLAGLLPCVVGLEDVTFGERDGREAIVEVLRAHPGPLAIVLPAGESVPLDAGHLVIDMPVLAEGDRLAVWRAALADSGLAVDDPAVLAARYRIGPGVIHRAIAAARVDGVPATDATPALERYIRQTRDRRLGTHARRVERLATWDGLVLPGDVLDSLHELVARVQHRRTVFETWGMEQTMATSRGLTALFSGPPGTGKTLVAGVIARELGLDLYQVDLSKLMSKWIGETERNLASIFDAAEDGQVILLFDEADSLFAKRTEVRSSNDRYANLEVNYLLQRLDSFEGIAILTTNASGSIDPAFKRRLSFRLSFPFPDEDTREQLWRAHLPPSLPVTGELALGRLAHKYQLSGGYIRNACLRAAFLAARDETALTQTHLERAVALEFAELGKLSSSGTIE